MVAIHGCTIKILAQDDEKRKRKNAFVIQHPDRRPVYLLAESERVMMLWLEALRKASKLDFGQGPSDNVDEYWQVLNFDPEKIQTEGPPTAKQIEKAYRRSCLKSHPDKGGDPEIFDKVCEAYEILTSMLEQQEQDKLYETFEYDAVVEKGPRGVGLGLVVSADAKKGTIIVTKVGRSGSSSK